MGRRCWRGPSEGKSGPLVPEPFSPAPGKTHQNLNRQAGKSTRYDGSLYIAFITLDISTTADGINAQEELTGSKTLGQGRPTKAGKWIETL